MHRHVRQVEGLRHAAPSPIINRGAVDQHRHRPHHVVQQQTGLKGVARAWRDSEADDDASGDADRGQDLYADRLLT